MGSPAEGERFFDERWPEARAVSDPSKLIYAAFGLERARAGQLLGPKTFVAGLKAFARGHGVGRPVGDPMMMSGWFLVAEGEVRWEHVHAHAGDERRFDDAESAWADLRSLRAAR
jgi:hypothetical protein